MESGTIKTIKITAPIIYLLGCVVIGGIFGWIASTEEFAIYYIFIMSMQVIIFWFISLDAITKNAVEKLSELEKSVEGN